jgi:phospholipid/cholesterol/gamma-HCH transport system substrate-binding protein
MNDRVVAFRVGVVVVAASVLATLLIVFFGSGERLFRGSYTIYLRFPTAPGVTVETPVRKNGVLIGRIKSVELFDDHVDLTAQIDSHRKLRNNEVARIKTASLLGDAVVEFVPPSVRDTSATANEYVQHGDLLADGLVASDPLQVLTNLEGNMQETIGSIKSAADEFTVLTKSLNQVMGNNDQRVQRILSKTELALDTMHGTMGTIDEFLGDPQFKDDLKRSLHGLPKLFDEVGLTLEEARQAMAAFDRVGAKAERNLDNLEKFTGPLGEQGPQIVADVERMVQNLEEASAQVSIFMEAVNSSDGTLSRLLNDDTLYVEARETIHNINQASRLLTPILNDVRIATDKAATDPSQFGLKGLLDRTPKGIGRKWTDAGIPLPSRRARDINPNGWFEGSQR